MFSDAAMYDKHRDFQIRDGEQFLTTVVQKMDWRQEDQDVIMDIGCGPGSFTRTMFLPAFPRVKKVIAVDVLPHMIEFANQNYTHDKIEYHVANIENGETVEKWSGQISKVVSAFCFNWLENQHEAFRNTYELLRPGGEAAFIFVLSLQFWDCYSSIIENPKWSKYLQNAKTYVPESYFKKQRAPYYRSMLEDIGYKVIICEDEDTSYTYRNDDDCRDTIYAVSHFISYIPDELKNEFKEDIFQISLKHSVRNKDGKPKFDSITINILIQKPNA